MPARRLRSCTSILGLGLLLGGFALWPVWAQAANAVAGEVIVLFQEKVTPEQLQAEAQRLGLSTQNMRSLQQRLVQQAGLERANRIEEIHAERLLLPEGMTQEEAIRRLSGSPLVRHCGLNYRRKPMALPNDPFYQQGYQWWAQAIGADRVVDEGILPEGAEVIIAILDTGVYLAHEDLAGRLVAGIDFFDVGGNGDVPLEMESYSPHGTHVAGIAAAATNNGVGIAGTASARNIKIMPVRVMDAYGGTDHVISQGVVWAVNHGAHVLNLSLGGPEPNPEIEAAIQYAYQKGRVVVVSAGNEAEYGNPVMYPAACAHVIAVGACDREGAHAAYSVHRDYVDVAAPGGIYVDVTATCVVSTIPYGYLYGDPQEYRYWAFQGTSMAAPMVAGAAAMLLAQHPGLAPEDVENIITTTAEKTGSLAAGGKSWDPYLGWGRLNVYNALTRDRNSTFAAKPSGRPSYNFPNPFQPSRGGNTRILIPLAAGQRPRSDAMLKIYDALGHPVRALGLAAAEIWPGATLVWDGRNAAGQWVGNGVYPYTLQLAVQEADGMVADKIFMNKIVVNNP